MPNAQVGRALITRRPPLFPHFTVRGGTWNEGDATKASQEMNGDEETFNISTYDRGDDVKCEGFPDAGFEPHVGDVLTEQWNPANGVQPGDFAPRSFVIVSPLNKKQFGKRALIFELNMIRRDALDTSIVTPE